MNVLFLFWLILGWFCSPIEDGWKHIKPLKTDKLTVDKILGAAEVDDNGYYRYTSDEVFVRVNYSSAPCQENQYERGKYSIPPNTVLNYYIVMKKATKLSELDFDRQKYKEDKSGDLVNAVRYFNEDDGISISVRIEDNVEYVGRIYFDPSKQNDENFKCKVETINNNKQ